MAGRSTGRPRKPSQIHRLNGNPSHRPLNNREPKPTVGDMTCPEWLSPKAKVEWQRILPELLRMGLATMVDRTTLAAYCQAHSELEEATILLDKEGRVIDEPIVNKAGEILGNKKRAHPAVSMQRDAFGRIKAFLTEFGLSPSSRSRLQVGDDAGEVDPLQELLNRAAS